MNPYFRTFTLLAATLVLGGCVTFQNLPNVPIDCDSKLAGTWQHDKEKRMGMIIDRQCNYFNKPDPEKKHVNAFKTFTINGNHFIAVQVPTDTASPGGDYFMLRYKLNNDQLIIYTADQTYTELAAEREQFETETRANVISVDSKYPMIRGSSADITRILKDHPTLFGAQSDKQTSDKNSVYIFQRVGSAGPATQNTE